ncbi:hypothetical protein F4802DRAFT_580872 [Xylaria palmicola]|nr:hypothetical protein F4802DRAFT_580872 [Xylaria palmicola]
MMDTELHEALFKGWADPDLGIELQGFDGALSPPRTRTHTHTDFLLSPAAGTPDHSSTGEKEGEIPAMGSPEGAEVPDSETDTLREPPSPPKTPSPRKKQPQQQQTASSTRPSAEIFGGGGGGDSNSISTVDSNSISTIDSAEERRLSDKMKKAWRGVTGQKLADPLEQWMVKHSGGMLREAPPMSRPRKGSHDRQ